MKTSQELEGTGTLSPRSDCCCQFCFFPQSPRAWQFCSEEREGERSRAWLAEPAPFMALLLSISCLSDTTPGSLAPERKQQDNWHLWGLLYSSAVYFNHEFQFSSPLIVSVKAMTNYKKGTEMYYLRVTWIGSLIRISLSNSEYQGVLRVSSFSGDFRGESISLPFLISRGQLLSLVHNHSAQWSQVFSHAAGSVWLLQFLLPLLKTLVITFTHPGNSPTLRSVEESSKSPFWPQFLCCVSCL